MKRRSFIQKSALATGAATLASPFVFAGTPPPDFDREIYQLRIYQLTSAGTKTALLSYLTSAVAPYLKSMGGRIGIFSEFGQTEPPKLYVLLTFPVPQTYYTFTNDMESDPTYQSNASSYLKSPFDKPLFVRYDTLLLAAFDGMPHFRMPDPSRGLLELRIYESYNEDAGRRKVAMFNREELPLFDKVGLPSMFFGKIMAGPFMPALAYMLAFKDMAQHDEIWAKFRVHPDWLTMRDKPENANTVSKVNKVFLVPEEGSQI
jgi:NIPSNAP